MNSLQEKILDKLIQGFPDFCFIEVRDFTDAHKNHHSVDKNKQSHFLVMVEDEWFTGKTRLERHRRVNILLKEFMEDIHALQMQLQVPGAVRI